MTSGDFLKVADIYVQGIETRHATFEKTAPSTWDEFAGRYWDLSRCVAVVNDEITGWAALSRVSARPVYSGVFEVSVYVHSNHRGKSIGRALLKHLVDVSEKNDIWTLQAGIFPENKASVKIHTDLGFRIVGTREKIGKMDDVWRDTLLLERRSKVIGTN